MKTSVTTCYDEHGTLLKRVTTTDFGVSEYVVDNDDKVNKALYITSIVTVAMMIVGIIGKIAIMLI